MPSKEGFYYTISIHATRAGGDLPSNTAATSPLPFQSTPPVRGATSEPPRIQKKWIVISIHATRAGGDDMAYENATTAEISIHATRAGGDIVRRTQNNAIRNFNPRHPCGGRRQNRGRGR